MNAFSLWTLNVKSRCLEDTASCGMMFLTGNLDIVGCFFHGPGYGRIRLFDSRCFSEPPYMCGRKTC